MDAKTALKVGALVCALQGGGAMALTLWDNGGPAVTNLGGSLMSDTQQAQDFVITSASDLTAVRFWSLEASPADYLGSIFYEVRNNASGAPGASVVASGSAAATRTAAGSVLGFNQFQNDLNVSIVNLAAGTYWLTLHDGPLASVAYKDYYWSWADIGGTNLPTNRGQEFGLDPLATAWSTNDQEHAFAVFGNVTAVPEPEGWALAGAALAALVVLRRRQT